MVRPRSWAGVTSSPRRVAGDELANLLQVRGLSRHPGPVVHDAHDVAAALGVERRHRDPALTQSGAELNPCGAPSFARVARDRGIGAPAPARAPPSSLPRRAPSVSVARSKTSNTLRARARRAGRNPPPRMVLRGGHGEPGAGVGCKARSRPVASECSSFPLACGSRSALETATRERGPAGLRGTARERWQRSWQRRRTRRYGGRPWAQHRRRACAGLGRKGESLPPILSAPTARRTPPTSCTAEGWCGSLGDYVAIWGSSLFDIWVAANNVAIDEASPANSQLSQSAVLHWNGLEWSMTPVLPQNYQWDLASIWGGPPQLTCGSWDPSICSGISME